MHSHEIIGRWGAGTKMEPQGSVAAPGFALPSANKIMTDICLRVNQYELLGHAEALYSEA